MEPDIKTLAKALGGGLPLAPCWRRRRWRELRSAPTPPRSAAILACKVARRCSDPHPGGALRAASNGPDASRRLTGPFRIDFTLFRISRRDSAGHGAEVDGGNRRGLPGGLLINCRAQGAALPPLVVGKRDRAGAFDPGKGSRAPIRFWGFPLNPSARETNIFRLIRPSDCRPGA